MRLLSRSRNILPLCALACLALGSAAHAQVIYDNGPIDGTTTAYTINFGFMVSDSFTVSTPSLTSGVQFGSWVDGGATPVSVDWSIGTTSFGSEVGSGTAALTNVLHNTNALGFFDVYQSSFALSQTLGAGTYFLTLQNAVASDGNAMFWDENRGPSSAQQQGNGFFSDRPSESFQILGAPTAVPEPGSIALLAGMGLSGAGFLARRRKNARKAA